MMVQYTLSRLYLLKELNQHLKNTSVLGLEHKLEHLTSANPMIVLQLELVFATIQKMTLHTLSQMKERFQSELGALFQEKSTTLNNSYPRIQSACNAHYSVSKQELSFL